MARGLTQPVHVYAARGFRIYVPVAIFTVLVAFVGGRLMVGIPLDRLAFTATVRCLTCP